MNFNFSPLSFAHALEFLHWWQWAVLAVWGLLFLWILEDFPKLAAFFALMPRHPVIAGVASFSTVWSLGTLFNDLVIKRQLAKNHKLETLN
ncbi:MAG: hypothetical protein IVW54_06255 [Candidatus Binataceae bacterium]|nr:hypothetical protein [Candidatus Binataceae bacterium]